MRRGGVASPGAGEAGHSHIASDDSAHPVNRGAVGGRTISAASATLSSRSESSLAVDDGDLVDDAARVAGDGVDGDDRALPRSQRADVTACRALAAAPAAGRAQLAPLRELRGLTSVATTWAAVSGPRLTISTV